MFNVSLLFRYHCNGFIFWSDSQKKYNKNSQIEVSTIRLRVRNRHKSHISSKLRIHFEYCKANHAVNCLACRIYTSTAPKL